MPSPMFSFRLNLERDRAYNAAAKAAKMELYEWVRMVCDEASGLTAPPTETQRPLDPNGPEPVAVPIKQRKKREKMVEREKPVAVITREEAIRDLKQLGNEVATKSTLLTESAPPPSQPRQYTGETQVWNGITMYEYGKGRWTKEPPPKK